VMPEQNDGSIASAAKTAIMARSVKFTLLGVRNINI
jgi:hypothetical protein